MAEAVSTGFDAELDDRLITIAGVEVRMVAKPPVGALIVFTRRSTSASIVHKIGSVLELCDKWIELDDLDELYDAVGNLQEDEVESFMDTDVAALVKRVAARPTLAQSS